MRSMAFERPSTEKAEPANTGTMTKSDACNALTTKNPILGGQSRKVKS